MSRYFGAHTLEGEWHSLLPRYVLLADRVDGKQILDIGCGTGIGSSLLLEMGAKGVNGIDHRPEVLELARIKHAKHGLNFQVMFWEELVFPDDAFDMVLCLDPTSPVTDPSLLSEIQRVLAPGGEYVCAIERRNIDGMESLLPRYGYETTGEQVDLSQSDEPVPQLGELEDFFETIVSIVQRPRYSYVFDYARDDEHTMRRSATSPDESGLWVGDEPRPDDESTQKTDSRPGRWLSIDRSLADRSDTSAAVELLFCGDNHMPPPTLREVQMPHRELIDRLQQLFSDLQLRSHPDETTRPNAKAPAQNEFRDREQTDEFRAPDPAAGPEQNRNDKPKSRNQSGMYTDRNTGAAPRDSGGDGWPQVRQQLDRMTRMYREVRAEMEDLFVKTRRELAERDRYIEQLVDTVHRWRHEIDDSHADQPPTSGDAEHHQTDEFEREPTSIFKRHTALKPENDPDSPDDSAPSSTGDDSEDGDGLDEQPTSPSDGEDGDGLDEQPASPSEPDESNSDAPATGDSPQSADETDTETLEESSSSPELDGDSDDSAPCDTSDDDDLCEDSQELPTSTSES